MVFCPNKQPSFEPFVGLDLMTRINNGKIKGNKMRGLNACAPECPQAADPTGRGRGYMMMVCPMEATVSFRLGTREVTFTTTMLP